LARQATLFEQLRNIKKRAALASGPSFSFSLN